MGARWEVGELGAVPSFANDLMTLSIDLTADVNEEVETSASESPRRWLEKN